MMSYKFGIRVKAEAVPALLAQWIENDLPVELTFKQRNHIYPRLVEVTITGDTPEEIKSKRTELMKTVRGSAFLGII